MSLRRTISLVTAVLVILLLIVSRHQIVEAWHLLGRVDLGILALLIPLQLLSYYAAGAGVFSYLKRKDPRIAIRSWDTARIALELNFVNHILPSGGVSGISYMSWRLSKHGIGTGRATLAQVVKFAAAFASYVLLLVIALIMITIDGSINRVTILVTSMLIGGIISIVVVLMYVIGSERRLQHFSNFFSAKINHLGQRYLRQRRPLVRAERIHEFFGELHTDYLSLKREPRLLVGPLGWGIVFNVTEVAMFAIAFWALGDPINPAPLCIAYGLAVFAGFLMVTPGGAGGFELIMITFLVSSGIDHAPAVAAVLLTRSLLIVMTIITGYAVYQTALSKYGKHASQR